MACDEAKNGRQLMTSSTSIRGDVLCKDERERHQSDVSQ